MLNVHTVFQMVRFPIHLADFFLHGDMQDIIQHMRLVQLLRYLWGDDLDQRVASA
jgi:hypothetical protein